MKYPPLIKSCEEAIRNEWCLGCQALAEPDFRGRINCKGAFPPETKEARECINKINEMYGIQIEIK